MTDASVTAIWLIVNAAAVTAAVRMSRHLFPHDTGPQVAMHSLLILWGSIVAISLPLGSAGWLRWEVMGGLTLALSVAVHLQLARAATRATRQTDAAPRRDRGPLASVLVLVWVCIGALAGGLVVDRLLGFPKHWDDLMYHLPLVDHWLQSGNLYVPGCTEWYNPGNGELIGLWCVAPFSGDFWVGVANLPVASLLVLAALEVGHELRLAAIIRNAVAIAAIATNVVLIQLTDLENDLAAVALFTAAVAYGARYTRTCRPSDCWLAATALGLLAGVKYYALGYAAVGCVGLACTYVVARRKVPSRLLSAQALATVVLAGYWYARNWLATGTPVFPLGFSEATDILDSVRPGAFRTTFLGNGRVDLWVQYFTGLRELTGPCQLSAVASIPTTALWLLVSAWVRLRDDCDRNGAALRVALALMLASSAFVYSITPFTVSDDDEQNINGAFTVVRYSQCPVLLALVAFALALDDICRSFAKRRWMPKVAALLAWLPGLLFFLIALVQLAIRIRQGITADVALMAVNIGLAVCLMYQLKDVVLKGPLLPRGAAGAAFLLLMMCSSAWLSHRWHADYAATFDNQFVTHVFTRLENEGAPANIAVADYRYYPFFGSRRQFRAHRPFRILSPDSLRNYLETYHINVLAVIRSDPFKYGRYTRLNDYVARETSTFEKIGSSAGFDVYRVKKPLRDVVSAQQVRWQTAGEATAAMVHSQGKR